MASKKQENKDGAQSGSAGADEKSGQKARDDSDDQVSREKPKEGEARDNLRRRAEWFQKRH